MLKRLSLSEQLLLLSGIPLLALLAFAGLLAEQTFETWRNVEQTVALGRLINAIEAYSQAIPAEAILSLGAQDTASVEQKRLIPASRLRSDAAVADLRKQAEAARLEDSMALKSLNAALAIDLRGNRERVDAGRQTLPDILATMRPATMQAIELLGRLAVLSTDAGVSRLILAYNVALSMNDAMLVEQNVRPIAGPDGQLAGGLVISEITGVAQQALLTEQFERLAAEAALPAWHRFLADPSAQEVMTLRKTVLGIDGTLDPSGVAKWTNATEQRLKAMVPVLELSSASLRQAVTDLHAAAGAALAGYATFVLVSFGLVLALVWNARRQLAGRIRRLSGTMRCLADGDLEIAIPGGGPADELGEMARTLASFKASLIERNRLAAAQAAATAALLDEKERLRVTLHSIGDGVIVTGSDERVTMMNAAALTLTGHDLDDALGSNINQVLTLKNAEGETEPDPPTERPDVLREIEAASGDVTLIRRNGDEVAIDASAARIFGQDSGLIGSITVLHDVTESRSLLNRIRQLAHYDTLTGLPNRALLNDRLAKAVQLARRMQRQCAVLFLDMDRFKHVKDTFGHAVGDLLLREVSHQLVLTVRGSDTVARLGGDEFIVILDDLADQAAAAEIARKILQSVARIDRIAGHEIDVSFSIGIAIYPHDGQDVDDLLMHADAAMYQAKDCGRNVSVFYDPDMDRANQRRNQMRLQLAKALQFRQLGLLFQPKIELDTGGVIGAEALLQWYPEPGIVASPAEFIPIAEESGLILPISDWVVSQACQQVQAWADQGRPPIPVSVNVSMKSLHNPGFAAKLRAVLHATALPPRSLEIEITESVAMADPERTLEILTEIGKLDVSISIDDFGTGFSSLSRLRRLPVDTIKIDRCFVTNMVEVEEDAALVQAIIGIARLMQKHVVAEGVETETQRAMLLALGCREGQGFLFSRPVGPDAFARLLARDGGMLVRDDNEILV